MGNTVSGQQHCAKKAMKYGITGSTLKWIAIFTMLIDHIGAVVLGRLLSQDNGYMLSGGAWDSSTLAVIYSVLRTVGRLAFPIFCFLLVEGFHYTHDKKKYAIRLGVFALVSEIPFDLAFNNHFLEFSSQNVFFTLFIGLLTMICYEKIEENQKWGYTLKMLLCTGCVGAGMGIAYLIRCDYSFYGVFCIMMLYLFQRKKIYQTIAGMVTFSVSLFPSEIPAVFAFLLIWFYNGRRGKQMKYFFYLFYPIHLLILYLICCALGIAGLSTV